MLCGGAPQRQRRRFNFHARHFKSFACRRRNEEPCMYKASANKVLPTSIIGSLPRPTWYTAALGNHSFLEAMVNSRYREQYEDAVSVFLRAQEMAGLDICTDGDAHYDEQVAGMSWQSYPLTHMAGFAATPEPAVYNVGAV